MESGKDFTDVWPPQQERASGGDRCVLSVAVTADGAQAVSGGNDGIVRVWDLAANRELASFVGHAGSVRAVAVTADGSRVVSGGDDSTVRVWDLAASCELAKLAGHAGLVHGVAVTADGARAVSGGNDGIVRVWDLAANRELASFVGHAGSVRAVAVTADGSRVVSGGSDGIVRVWDLTASCELAKLVGHAGLVHGVAVTANGSQVVSGGFDGKVRVWDLATGRELAEFGYVGPVRAVAVTADGSRAVSGGTYGVVQVWDLAVGTELARFGGLPGSVRGVAVTADGSRVVSGGSDGVGRVWDLAASHRLFAYLAEWRSEHGPSQMELAKKMHTSSRVVERLESPQHDPRLSTLVRYVTSLGLELNFTVTDRDTHRQVWSSAPKPIARPRQSSPLRRDEEPSRIGESFKNGYLALVAIIQGVAFGALVTVAVNATSTRLPVAQTAALATEAFVTLIAIVAITDEYLQLLRAVQWNPSSVDTVIPYALGSGEVVAALSVGSHTRWWAAISFVLIMAVGAFRYSERHAKEATSRAYWDTANRRRFAYVVRRLRITCSIMLFYAVTICLLSAFAVLSPVAYVFAPPLLLFGLLVTVIFLPRRTKDIEFALFKATPGRQRWRKL